MQNTSTLFRNGVIAVIAGLFTLPIGCAGLEKPYPNKTLQTISVGKPSETVAPPGSKVLRVSVARVARPFDGLTFVYKTGDSTYATDYYNGFITSPDLIITGELNNWLSQSGLYSSVVDGDSGADSQLSLETNVNALYGDFSGSSPAAVIGAKIFLIDYSSGKYSVVFQKDYLETEPIASRAPTELVKGWERAYRRMLTQLVSDLKKPATVAADAGTVR
jgi:uncharacterized lipoprotein YmbA